ncbi:MAG: chromate efflux transporter [Verrucomicrobiota bacterium]
MRITEIFWAFLKLGCLAFGGPSAHLAYFEEAFVRRRQWLSASEFAEILALCQFLPGPGSSQVGFALGLLRGGVPGAFAAWLGFTLPATVIMIGFAYGIAAFGDFAEAGWISGLLVAAMAVVANAVVNMGRKLCTDIWTLSLAMGAAILLSVVSDARLQLLVILSGGLFGAVFLRHPKPFATEVEGRVWVRNRRLGMVCLAGFFIFLLGLPVLAQNFESELMGVADAFYRAGSLVFGGGHVVLPLLDGFTVQRGWLEEEAFLAGYGAAQAIPGPLFAYTAYLGASMQVGLGGVWGGLYALVFTYLPAWLLVLGVLPTWVRWRDSALLQSALRGVNAVVVGVLMAALYDPVIISGAQSLLHITIGFVAFYALQFRKAAPLLVVLICGILGQSLL